MNDKREEDYHGWKEEIIAWKGEHHKEHGRIWDTITEQHKWNNETRETIHKLANLVSPMNSKLVELTEQQKSDQLMQLQQVQDLATIKADLANLTKTTANFFGRAVAIITMIIAIITLFMSLKHQA